jgi:mRNA-degrading endonuclease RelE of RelBE toxin-antitoxin system
MRYTVTSSSPMVEEELALIWLQAANRDEVKRAADEIERILKFSPLAHGIDYGEYRSLTVGPVRVTYDVSQADCLVTILQYTYLP